MSGQSYVFPSLPSRAYPRYSLNWRLGGFTTGLGVLEKRKIPCLCRESNHDSMVVQSGA